MANEKESIFLRDNFFRYQGVSSMVSKITYQIFKYDIPLFKLVGVELTPENVVNFCTIGGKQRMIDFLAASQGGNLIASAWARNAVDSFGGYKVFPAVYENIEWTKFVKIGTHQVQCLDENGNAISDSQGNLVWKDVPAPVVDDEKVREYAKVYISGADNIKDFKQLQRICDSFNDFIAHLPNSYNHFFSLFKFVEGALIINDELLSNKTLEYYREKRKKAKSPASVLGSFIF